MLGYHYFLLRLVSLARLGKPTKLPFWPVVDRRQQKQTKAICPFVGTRPVLITLDSVLANAQRKSHYLYAPLKPLSTESLRLGGIMWMEFDGWRLEGLDEPLLISQLTTS